MLQHNFKVRSEPILVARTLDCLLHSHREKLKVANTHKRAKNAVVKSHMVDVIDVDVLK